MCCSRSAMDLVIALGKGNPPIVRLCSCFADGLPSLAYLEMRLILARIIWNFDVELLPESQGWDQQKVFVLWLKNPLFVKLKAREGGAVRAN